MQKVVFLSFLKILFCVQLDAEKSLHTPVPFSMRKLFGVGK
jgi:hypothetical protein